MAIRGKVKIVRDMGSNYTGTVTDTANKVDYEFEQPLGKELGLVEGMIVRMEIITKSDGTQLAVSLDPVEKGTIQSLDAGNNTGTLKDNAGNIITINQNYITELGLTDLMKVNYTVVLSAGSSGMMEPTATALRKAN